MQTSYATISQLLLALFAAQAVAAPVAVGAAGSSTELDARSPEPVKMCGDSPDKGFGCVTQCYGTNCATMPRSKPAPAKRSPFPPKMCGNSPDKGFGCVTQCYGANCATMPRSKPAPAKRDEEEVEVAAAAAEDDDNEVEKRTPAPVKMCGGFPDLGFGCVTQCYGSNCGESPRSKPAKRDEGVDAEAAQVSEDDAEASEE
ncbi:hypothetical protein PspLS_10279 [Pyricularia sp. CBS 133598]|nr:hypothetical protein PspLS_10279 [Pyricularia sp. CBS 133598]